MKETNFSNLPVKGRTMSSLEIAEITGKRHADVMRDIRNLLKQGVQERNFALSFIIRKLPNGGSKKEPIYNLTKKGSLILASGYDALLRERIIDRWEVLETEHQAEMRDPTIAMNKAIAYYERQGKSPMWIQARFDGQVQRHTYTDTLKAHGVKGYGYATCTNAIYKPILSCTAKGFLRKNNLPEKANPRDHMSIVELMAVGLSEALASEGIEKKDVHGNEECANVSSISAINVAKAVEVSRRQIG